MHQSIYPYKWFSWHSKESISSQQSINHKSEVFVSSKLLKEGISQQNLLKHASTTKSGKVSIEWCLEADGRISYKWHLGEGDETTRDTTLGRCDCSFLRHQLVPMRLSCYKEQAEGAGSLDQCKTLYPACLRARISAPRTERRRGRGGRQVNLASESFSYT